MNEKYFKDLIILLCIIIFSTSCASRRIFDNGSGVDKVRSNITELEKKQSEAIIANSEIGNKIERSREITEDIKDEIESGTGDSKEFEEILYRIRERNKHKNNHIKSKK